MRLPAGPCLCSLAHSSPPPFAHLLPHRGHLRARMSVCLDLGAATQARQGLRTPPGPSKPDNSLKSSARVRTSYQTPPRAAPAAFISQRVLGAGKLVSTARHPAPSMWLGFKLPLGPQCFSTKSLVSFVSLAPTLLCILCDSCRESNRARIIRVFR